MLVGEAAAPAEATASGSSADFTGDLFVCQRNPISSRSLMSLGGNITKRVGVDIDGTHDMAWHDGMAMAMAMADRPGSSPSVVLQSVACCLPHFFSISIHHRCQATAPSTARTAPTSHPRLRPRAARRGHRRHCGPSSSLRVANPPLQIPAPHRRRDSSRQAPTGSSAPTA